MDNISQISLDDFHSARIAIQEAVNSVQLMLWAGDYLKAREEVETVYSKFSRIIKEVQNLKTRLIADFRKQPGNSRTGEKMYQGSPLETNNEDLRFILIPQVSNLASADRRISDILGLQTVLKQRFTRSTVPQGKARSLPLDEDTQFRYSAVLLRKNQWQIKLYRTILKENTVSVRNVLHILLLNFSGKAQIIEHSDNEGQLALPVILRILGEDIFSEVTIYSSYKAMIELTLNEEFLYEHALRKIMMAIHKSH